MFHRACNAWSSLNFRKVLPPPLAPGPGAERNLAVMTCELYIRQLRVSFFYNVCRFFSKSQNRQRYSFGQRSRLGPGRVAGGVTRLGYRPGTTCEYLVGVPTCPEFSSRHRLPKLPKCSAPQPKRQHFPLPRPQAANPIKLYLSSRQTSGSATRGPDGHGRTGRGSVDGLTRQDDRKRARDGVVEVSTLEDGGVDYGSRSALAGRSVNAAGSYTSSYAQGDRGP